MTGVKIVSLLKARISKQYDRSFVSVLFAKISQHMKISHVYLSQFVAGIVLLLANRMIGQSFTNLHNFASGDYDSSNYYTNSEGAGPWAELTLGNNKLYGTASHGGSSGWGTVFALNLDGNGFTNLYSFSATDLFTGTNSDGASPLGGVVLSDNTLYGTAYGSGSLGNGTIFAIGTDGTGFTNLHNFGGVSQDGAHPRAALLLSGTTLYGTASSGGRQFNGTIFGINSDGSGFTNLYLLSGSEGVNPDAGLVLSSVTLYGAAPSGGAWDSGTIYSLKTNGTGFA